MLKREITFEDFNGETVTETHYFNLTKTELMELEADYSGGLEASLVKIIEAKDNKTLLTEFKRIVMMAYGEKSADGRRFVKNQQLCEEFSQTAAFDALFVELASNEEAGAAFISGVMPRDLQEELTQMDLKSEMAEKLGVTHNQPKTTAEIAAEQA